MEVEQRFIIRFLLKKGYKTKGIIKELKETYNEDSYSKTTVYFWVKKIKLGREDLNDIPSLGRPIDSQIDQFIINEIFLNPHIRARSLARKASFSKTMILDHLHDSLGMKNVHLR